MNAKKNRRRGVVLSSSGQQRIENARRELEKSENGGDRYTIEELSERSQLSLATMTKVLAARIGVDKQTLDLVFVAFGLQMERADYHQPEHHEELALETANDSPTAQVIDWGEAIDVSMFYGREPEITTLTTWIEQDNCRLIAMLGMGGIGKTALSVKLAQTLIQNPKSKIQNFEFIVWRSLRNAPPLESLLNDIIQVLSSQQENLVAVPISTLFNRLLHYLRQHRCLLVLDNSETILQSGEFAGVYRQDYEVYGELFHQVGEISHQSCLVLTSREKPETIANLEGITLPVRSIALDGLLPRDSDRLFAAIGLSSSSSIGRHKLMEVYGGNPLALKIVATSIREIFDGDVDGFLGAETTVFNGIRRLLDQQYQRLMPIEQQVMTWLAIDREWVTIAQLQADIVPSATTQGLMEALESLSRRSLIEQKNARFTQQPVVMEYMTERLIDRVCAEIASLTPNLFNTYALTKTTVKEYIRESQIRLILQPIAKYLRDRFRSIEELERQMQQILELVRRSQSAGSSYGAGNAIGLMQYLQIDLTGYDFADLTIRQVCFQDTPLHRVNMARAHPIDCRFAEPITEPHSSAINPTGELLAIGGQDGTVQMRRASTGQLLFAVRAHTTFVLALTFSPDGKTLVSGCIGGGIKFWDVNTGNCQQTWDKGKIWTLAYSPDGQLLVAALSDRDNSIYIWDVQTAECLKILIGHTAPVCGIAFAPYRIDNRQLMVTTGQDSVVKIWDVESGDCVRTLTEHTGQIWSVCFHPQGDRFATCSFDRSIKIWDIATGACLQTLLGHTKEVSRVRFSPDGHLLVSACTDRTARLWDTVTGKCLKVLQGHLEPVWAVEFTAGYLGSTARNEQQADRSIAERFLVSIGLDRALRFWDISYQYRSNPLSIDPTSISSHCLKTIQGGGEGIRTMAIHPDRRLFATGGMSESIHLWDLCSQSEPYQPNTPSGTSAPTGKCLQKLTVHHSSTWTIAFHPQGKLLASGHLNGEMRIWEVESGKCLHNLPTNHSYMIQFCRFSPQGDLIGCIGSTESSIRFWDIHTGECWRTIWLEAESYIFGLDFHPQGHYFVTAGHDDRLCWWDMQSGECFRSQASNEGHVWAIAFHPQGHLFATVGGSPDVKIWDAESGECLRLLAGHTGNLGGVAFSPDGSILASGRSDRTIRLWDVATGECLHVLAGHSSGVTSVGFLSDSSQQILASASFDGTIRLWDVQSGACLNMFRPDRLYEGMNITGITGLTEGAIATLKSLGAV